MDLSTLSVAPPAAPYPVARADIRTVPLRGARWRVTRPGGEILGYLERVGDGPTARYRSSRMRGRHDGFVPLGEYASPADALDVVRG